MAAQAAGKSYRFGAFQLDVLSGELRKSGVKVRTQNQPLRILALLLERAGEVVTREELREALWPKDTFVDFDNGLNAAVAKLRQVLCDSAENPRYIETIPRRGYRFIAAVGPDCGAPGTAVADVLPQTPAAPRRSRRARAGIVAAACAVGAAIVVLVVWSARTPEIRVASVERLTTSGQVSAAAISPDGRLLAYTSHDVNSIRVRTLATGADVEIVPPGRKEPCGISFSPDSRFVYYSTAGVGVLASPDPLQRVPVSGGVPTALPAGNACRCSLSPDGRRLVFDRIGADATEIVVANPDGSSQASVATARFPLFVGVPSWSPKGDSIAYAATPSGFFRWQIMVQPATAGGRAYPLSPHIFFRITSTVWIGGNDAVVFVAEDEPDSRRQLWTATYGSRRLSRLTSDLDDYANLSATSDSSNIATVRSERISSVMLVSVAGGSDAGMPRQVTAPGEADEGVGGMAFTPDGRMVLASRSSGHDELWIVNRDGSDKRQLTQFGTRSHRPSVPRTGDFVVFTSTRGNGGHNIWRMALDGTDIRQLTTTGTDSSAIVSPDGKWICYQSFASGARRLRRMNADGSAGRDLTDAVVQPYVPSISPDGSRVAFIYYDAVAKDNRVGIVASSGEGQMRAQLTLPEAVWTPDGKGLCYRRRADGADNIWVHRITGGADRQLTRFSDGRIYAFAWSMDGKTLGVVHGSTTGDAVMIHLAR